MIIIVFMGGLGLGSFVGGRWFSRRGDTLVPYSLMELSIGVFVLVSPALLNVLTDVFTEVADAVADRAVLTLVRVVVNMLALFGPAFVGPVSVRLGNRAIFVSGLMSGLVGYAVGNYLGLFVAWILS
jgi:uncharacterized membrane protein